MKILYNGHFCTLDPSTATKRSIAIQGGRILAVGDDFDGKQEGIQTYNLGGRSVIPGLTDAHIHLQQYALSMQKVNCETKTLVECLRRVQDRTHHTLPGEWILGHGWNQNEWQDNVRGRSMARSSIHPGAPAPQLPNSPAPFPTSTDLDNITPNHPVYLTAKSLHAAWVNHSALHLADITAQTPDPDNGQIMRDAHGNPTGILLESAMQMVFKIIPEPTVEQVAQAIQVAQPLLWRMGLTGVHDFDRRTCFTALQILQARCELGLRVVKSIPLEDLHHAVSLGLRTGFGNDFLRIGSIKTFADGALGPRTAAMLQPYEGVPSIDQRGMLLLDAEELFEQGKTAVENGLSLAVHAIGDRANHEVLNAIEQLRELERSIHRRQSPELNPLRHRIEHVQLIQPDDAHRLATLGVIASMQPIHAPSDMIMADRNWGERSVNAYAWRMLVKHNTCLAFGSDAPVESPNPFWGLYAAITRRRMDGTPGPEGWYPEQRLSLLEAFQGYTTGAAYAAGMENHLGKLAPGYLADLLVLNDDPFTCQPEQLLDLQPVATMVNGDWVFQEIFD